MDLEQIVKLAKLLESDKPSKDQDCDCSEIKIVILQRGWVMVGRFGKSGSKCKLENAAVIRTWGTSKGLGEIALNGPITDKTIIDPCGDVEFHELTAVAIMDCDQSKWKKVLK